ncbi:glutathione S-transferase family protein [Cupriavidus sp. AU9028]|uniref:glutathione S-transferase family protein n=1 Tax=Cupriavidus sp. AU9028 TaxID=2871157 RepID=UPI001C98ACEF|nr:glutathione S-transferase family protein [Cupriavidus sp. AU9028]MBY4896653.1 glutathione S-transferase family protein [Cupriavidus sp. AU9028]
MKLVIGNKNYSSWSLRPWIALTHAGIPFEEANLRLFTDSFDRDVAVYSASGKVPVLVDGDVRVWDSLAIVEYLAERFPEHRLWPADPVARAYARSICAEMHSGFANLRSQMPMNIVAMLPGLGWNRAVQRDIDRIAAIWTDARQRYGQDGPFLFGQFSNADAFYAPVVSRFATYGVHLPEPAKAYADFILALPAMQQWIEGARKERDFVVADEPYRPLPTDPEAVIIDR